MTPPKSLTPDRIAQLTGALRRTPESGETAVIMPFDGELLYRLPHTGTQQIIEAAAEARVMQRDWAARPVRDRAAVLDRLHDLLLAHTEDLLDVIQAESGKARAHAFEEIADVANTCRYYARTAPHTLAARRRSGAFPLLTRTVELRHPVGLIGLISPWNYPLTLAASDALPALVAGNAVLHKPDSRTVLTALMVRRLAVQAGLPPQLWQVVVGPGDSVGPELIDRVDHLVFTGSTATGRTVAQQAGRRLLRTELELGGKNAMIVCRDAALRSAVGAAVRGAFGSAGQLCVSIESIYVAREVADEFLQRFVTAVRGLTLGSGFDYRSDIGSLLGPAQLVKVTGHVDDAVRHGAVVAAGGRHRPDIGPYFFEPTVLTGVPPEAACFAEETFGPLVSVYPVASDADAVAAANASRYGLSASVFSRDAARARGIATQLRAGMVNINEAYAAAWGSIDSPIGGVKDSGVGRRHGADGLLASTWSQTVARQRIWPIGEYGVLRGRRHQRAITAALRAMKAMRRR